jgi:hypothetical protein
MYMELPPLEERKEGNNQAFGGAETCALGKNRVALTPPPRLDWETQSYDTRSESKTSNILNCTGNTSRPEQRAGALLDFRATYLSQPLNDGS